jgi:hypothetical protein
MFVDFVGYVSFCIRVTIMFVNSVACHPQHVLYPDIFIDISIKD